MRLALLLFFVANAALAAEPSGAALAEKISRARISDGFEARMSIAVVRFDGARAHPVKFAVIGRFTEKNQRLLIRGISPEAVRERYVAAERTEDGAIRAIGYRSADTNATPADPYASLFDSTLTVWDMFAPWYGWSRQQIVGTEKVAGRACTLLRSQTDHGKIREAISCVDPDAGLSLRTQLFDRNHALLRTLTVQRLMRKDSGAMAASKLTVAESDHTTTEVDVYGGDEHYPVSPDIFARLDTAGGK